jgi:hypothetical protein
MGPKDDPMHGCTTPRIGLTRDPARALTIDAPNVERFRALSDADVQFAMEEGPGIAMRPRRILGANPWT